MPRAFLASRNARADEQNALIGERLGASVGVRIVGVAAIDNDVALFEMRRQVGDHLVDGVAGLDHQHHAARLLQDLRQLLDGVRAHHLGAGGFVRDEIVDLRNGAIEDGHAISVVVHIQDQVLAHYREADQADVTGFGLHECYCSGKKTGVRRQKTE